MNILQIIFAVIVFVAILISFFVLYLKKLESDARIYWNELLDLLRIRSDRLPLVYETLKMSNIQVDDKTLALIVDLKNKSWKSNKCDTARFALEKDVKGVWDKFLKTGNEHQGLKHNVNFLGLKQEYIKLEKDLTKLVDKYNFYQRRFNRLLKLWLLDFVLKFQQFMRFE